MQALNELEGSGSKAWRCAAFTDTGPVLRLEHHGVQLSKQQRYGNPCDRPVYSSFIPAERFESVVLSYFRHALQDVHPKYGGWSWADTHSFNRAVDWHSWKA